MHRHLRLGHISRFTGPVRAQAPLCDPPRMGWRLRKAIHHAKRVGSTFSIITFRVDPPASASPNLATSLRFMEQVVRSNIRRSDQFGRWIDGEYLALAPNLELSDATGFAIRLRHLLAEEVRVDGSGHLTASFGVCQYQERDTVEALVGMARACMESASELGGNRVRAVRR